MGFVKSINIMKVRAKFECDSIEDQPDYQFKLFKFTPVLDGGEEAYEEAMEEWNKYKDYYG